MAPSHKMRVRPYRSHRSLLAGRSLYPHHNDTMKLRRGRVGAHRNFSNNVVSSAKTMSWVRSRDVSVTVPPNKEDDVSDKEKEVIISPSEGNDDDDVSASLIEEKPETCSKESSSPCPGEEKMKDSESGETAPTIQTKSNGPVLRGGPQLRRSSSMSWKREKQQHPEKEVQGNFKGSPSSCVGEVDGGETSKKRSSHFCVVKDTNKPSLSSNLSIRRNSRLGVKVQDKRLREGDRGCGKGAKRIRLDVGESSPVTRAEQDDGVSGGDGVDCSASEKKLTDFAYRETLSRGGGSSGKYGSPGRKRRRITRMELSNDGKTFRNMGLVRVKPNESRTPVCRSFLGGVQCSDIHCTRRHDLPPESVIPICSFFQRNGQCFKRDSCPFRHVKVNPRAAICPSFSLLGFCEDTGCVMKHIRQKTVSK